MRLVKVLCLVLLFSGLAAAQVSVIGGTASYWSPYGIYGVPIVPLVNTPSVTLATVSPSGAGASNATFGLVAGATNSTLSDEFVASPPVGVYSQPVWYGPSEAPEIAARPAREGGRKHEAPQFDFISSGNLGAAQLMASAGPARKAGRTYTNSDIDRINQTTGTVKWDGKTEHL